MQVVALFTSDNIDMFHAAACACSGGRTGTHNSISHATRQILTASGLRVDVEPTSYLANDKRADVHTSCGSAFVPSDHSIACAHGSQHAASAAKHRGAHITAVEAIKDTKYSEEYRRNWGAKFYPVVLDTNGGWGKGVNEEWNFTAQLGI